MDHDSEMMWQHLQMRLERRFGKYFKDDEGQSKQRKPEGKPSPDVTVYKAGSSKLTKYTNH